jgi:hypothetical protein
VPIVTPDPDARRSELAWYEAGLRDGIEIGMRLEAKERDRLWNRIAAPIAHGGPSHAELETRRWGPGGRRRFAEPRPGDFIGRGAAA